MNVGMMPVPNDPVTSQCAVRPIMRILWPKALTNLRLPAIEPIFIELRAILGHSRSLLISGVSALSRQRSRVRVSLSPPFFSTIYNVRITRHTGDRNPLAKEN
jgi:hypothetical protein